MERIQSFRAWLKNAKQERSPLGDLARDVDLDPDFPAVYAPTIRYREKILSHLFRNNACEGAILAAEQAFNQWATRRLTAERERLSQKSMEILNSIKVLEAPRS